MTLRKNGPLYDKWHRRVEGQIRHTIGKHPEWFRLKNDDAKRKCINSLAKRIVGEIAADCKLAAMSEVVVADCDRPRGEDGASIVSSSGRGDAAPCSPPAIPEGFRPRHLSTGLAYLEQIADDQEMPDTDRAWAQDTADYLRYCMERDSIPIEEPLGSVLIDDLTTKL